MKKVDNSRGGYSTPVPLGAASSGQRAGMARYLVPALAFAIAALAAFSFYWTRQKAASPTAPNKSATVSKKARPVGAAIARHEDVAAKGVSLYKLSRFAEAEAEFREAAKAAPQDPVNRNNLGAALMMLGRTDEAETAFKTALEIRPAYPEALNNYGGLLDKKGDTKGAIRLFEKALALAPDYPEAHLNLAVCLERSGEMKKAANHYRAYLDSRPGDERVKEKLSRLGATLQRPRKGGPI